MGGRVWESWGKKREGEEEEEVRILKSFYFKFFQICMKAQSCGVVSHLFRQRFFFKDVAWVFLCIRFTPNLTPIANIKGIGYAPWAHGKYISCEEKYSLARKRPLVWEFQYYLLNDLEPDEENMLIVSGDSAFMAELECSFGHKYIFFLTKLSFLSIILHSFKGSSVFLYLTTFFFYHISKSLFRFQSKDIIYFFLLFLWGAYLEGIVFT